MAAIQNVIDRMRRPSQVPITITTTPLGAAASPRRRRTLHDVDADTLHSLAPADDSDNETLYSLVLPTPDELRAPHLLARWQPGDKERFAALLARLDEMVDDVIRRRNALAIKTARELVAGGGLLERAAAAEMAAEMPREISEGARESLACCVADAFCRWSSERADLKSGRGRSQWQLDHYAAWRRPLRVLGTSYFPDTDRSRVAWIAVELKYNLRAISVSDIPASENKPTPEAFAFMTDDRVTKHMAGVLWGRLSQLHQDIMTLESRKVHTHIQGRKALFLDMARPLR